MNIENRCPQCGAELAANAPRGLCPACLLKGALASQTSAGSDQSASSNFTPPTPEQLAAQFPELEILEFIGRGGMGMVYKARQKHLDRLVALKILLPSIAQDAAFAERFAREARAMAMLSHPHIVTVHDFGQKDSLYYFLMEFVDGLTLRQLLNAGTLVPQEALAIVPQICEALQFAHDKGVVHRDIKPENILMDRNGQVKIADFGLAKLMGQDAKDFTITGTGQVMGTPHYMAPEQTEHPQEVDHRADIYSLGVVFYQMLTGELPLGRFAPPSRKVQIDVRLDEVVLRALEKEPDRRYQQASEIKTHVETIVTTPPANVSRKPPCARWQRYFVMVGRRGGKAVLNWPGIAMVFVMIVGITEGGGALASWHLTGGMDQRGVIIGLLGALLAFGIGLRRARTTPTDRLMDLDTPSTAWHVGSGATGSVLSGTGSTRSPSSVDAQRSASPSPSTGEASSTAAIDDARWQVQGPAIGLLILGILELLTVPVVLVLITIFGPKMTVPGVPGIKEGAGAAYVLEPIARAAYVLEPIAMLVAGLLAVLGSFTIIAARKMKRLEAYGLAITASILAILISPSNLIGLAIGIWSLVVLCRREVAKAFEQKRAMLAELHQPATGFQRAMGIAGLMLCLANFPLALVGPVLFGFHTWFFIFVISPIPLVISLVFGILGWRSVPGKAASIVSGGLLIVLGLMLVMLTTRKSLLLLHNFRGPPSLQRLDAQDSTRSLEAQLSQAVTAELRNRGMDATVLDFHLHRGSTRAEARITGARYEKDARGLRRRTPVDARLSMEAGPARPNVWQVRGEDSLRDVQFTVVLGMEAARPVMEQFLAAVRAGDLEKMKALSLGAVNGWLDREQAQRLRATHLSGIYPPAMTKMLENLQKNVFAERLDSIRVGDGALRDRWAATSLPTGVVDEQLIVFFCDTSNGWRFVHWEIMEWTEKTRPPLMSIVDDFAQRTQQTLDDAKAVGSQESLEQAAVREVARRFLTAVGDKKQLVNFMGMKLVLIPAGEFTMADDSATPAHRVTITKPFYLGQYEVTQEQWEAVMGGNPSRFKGPKNPVEQVSWDDCQQFLVKLNAKAGGQGGKFVLPTEAQWEYACRAGSTGKFCFGDDEKQLGEYAWYGPNSDSKTNPVGEKKPNAFGLYDMHGNVWELCQDWYGTYGAEAVTDPSGPATGASRVHRGGSWCNGGRFCQSAYRAAEPGRRGDFLGLRVARVPAE